MSGFGRTLQEARRRKGLTLDEVERETRIRKRYLLALEQDEFEQLPPPVYALGFIRVYARFLDLDPAPLAQQFAEATGAVVAPVPLRKKAVVEAPLPASAQSSSTASSLLLVIIVAAAFVLAGSRLKDPLATAIAGLGGDKPAAPTAQQPAPRPATTGAPARTPAAAAPVPVGEAAGGGDAAPPTTANAPRLLMTPPWFREPAPASDPRSAAPSVQMPSLVGKSADAARETLERLGAAVATEAWASDTAPKGTVLWQQPEPGASLPKGQLALLAVSKGPKVATVPDVVGKTQADAAKALQQAGIVNPPVVNFQGPKDLSPSVLSGVCNGCVLSVSPPPGAETAPDSIVVIAVRKD